MLHQRALAAARTAADTCCSLIAMFDGDSTPELCRWEEAWRQQQLMQQQQLLLLQQQQQQSQQLSSPRCGTNSVFHPDTSDEVTWRDALHQQVLAAPQQPTEHRMAFPSSTQGLLPVASTLAPGQQKRIARLSGEGELGGEPVGKRLRPITREHECWGPFDEDGYRMS